jgi:hypothetical protein
MQYTDRVLVVALEAAELDFLAAGMFSEKRCVRERFKI